MNTSNPLNALDSPLHIQWREDRALRQRVRLSQSWRGCMGLAMMIDPGASVYAHGQNRLVPNHAVTWVALRDVPVGHWHFEPSRTVREVNYTSTAVADLHFGMARIDFTPYARNAVDFRLCPFGTLDRQLPDGRWRRATARGDVLNSDSQSRLFAVLNRISAAMTRFAFTAVKANGTPVRPIWFAHRPVKELLWPIVAPRDWMPRPNLGFDSSILERLYDAISLGDARVEADDHRCVSADMSEPLRPGFCSSLRQMFCSSVADGLPLHARSNATYLGIVHGRASHRGDHVDLQRHMFLLESGEQYHVDLPPFARIEVRVGGKLNAGQRWCSIVPDVPARWKDQPPFEQWNTLHRILPRRSIGTLQRLWFFDQAVHLPDRPRCVFFPAHLVSRIVRDIRPVALHWDVAPAGPYLDDDLRAAIFPPLRLGSWDRLRWSISDILIDASITDPRLQIENRHGLGDLIPPRHQPRARSIRIEQHSKFRCLLAGPRASVAIGE